MSYFKEDSGSGYIVEEIALEQSIGNIGVTPKARNEPSEETDFAVPEGESSGVIELSTAPVAAVFSGNYPPRGHIIVTALLEQTVLESVVSSATRDGILTIESGGTELDQMVRPGNLHPIVIVDDLKISHNDPRLATRFENGPIVGSVG